MIQGEGKLKEVSIEAVVIRADGSKEDLGQVSYWHRSPLRRAVNKIKEKLNGNVRS